MAELFSWVASGDGVVAAAGAVLVGFIGVGLGLGWVLDQLRPSSSTSAMLDATMDETIRGGPPSKPVLISPELESFYASDHWPKATSTPKRRF